jgi:hypothetical protein
MRYIFWVNQYFKTMNLNTEPQHFLKIKNQKDEEYFFIFLIKINEPRTTNLSIFKKFPRETP